MCVVQASARNGIFRHSDSYIVVDRKWKGGRNVTYTPLETQHESGKPEPNPNNIEKPEPKL